MCDLVEHRSVPYPPAVRHAISAILPPAPTTIEQVCQLDVAIGQFFGEVAKDPGGRAWRRGRRLLARPDRLPLGRGRRGRGTLQLGEPAWIAERTGAAVVSDVRNRDIAAGGHGAPLASLLDVLLLGRLTRRSPAARSTSAASPTSPSSAPAANRIAFDIGPANALIDAAVEWLTERRRALRPRRGLGGRGAGSTRPLVASGCWTTPTSRCRRPSRPARSTSTSAT